MRSRGGRGGMTVFEHRHTLVTLITVQQDARRKAACDITYLKYVRPKAFSFISI